MAEVFQLMRPTTDEERRHRSPTLHGDHAYREGTGVYVKLLPGKFVGFDSHDPDPSDNGNFRHALQTPKSLGLKELKRALYNTIGRVAGCGHSYDCCGCANESLRSIHRIRRGQFSIVIHHSRNF